MQKRLLVVFLTSPFLLVAGNALSGLPLYFEPAPHVPGADISYTFRGAQHELLLSPSEVTLNFWSSTASPDRISMRWVGGNPHASLKALSSMEGKSNYLLGDDPKLWRTDVPHYGEVRYREIYPGVDLAFHGGQNELEYDLIVSPGRDPKQIELEFSGRGRITVGKNGDLLLSGDGHTLVQHAPSIYQEKNGKRTTITGSYVARGHNHIGFSIGSYDPAQTLVIDPVFGFSTVFGGSGTEAGQAIAVDSSGNMYIAGQTTSPNFPVVSPIQTAGGSSNRVLFVSKLNAAGTSLIYSTYLGGSNDNEARGIAVDSAGNAYVAGYTNSFDFPYIPGSLQMLANGYCCGNNDPFVVKLNPAGSSLVFTARFGGSGDDVATGLTLDASGAAYVTGYTGSIDFPQTAGAYSLNAGTNQTKIFVSKLNPAGTALSYSSVFGGNQSDQGFAIATDALGSAYITGITSSTNFPVTAGAYLTQIVNSCCYNQAFVTKLTPAGDALVFSTYLGATNGNTTGYAIKTDASNMVYVTGTTSSPSFPSTPGAYRSLPVGSNSAAFLTKFTSDGSALVYSALFGGSGFNVANSLGVDSSGNATAAGYTNGANFPVTAGAPELVFTSRYPNNFYPYQSQNGFVSQFDSTGASLRYSTYLGGSGVETLNGLALDTSGYVYVTGTSTSPDFPMTPGAFRSFNQGQVFVSKIVHPSTCTFAVGPASYNSGPLQSSTLLTITSQSGCNWVGVSPVPWVILGTGGAGSGSSGSGSGTLNVTVDENLGSQRSTTLTIAGNTFPVVQTAGCQYTLSSPVKAFTASGGNESVTALTPQICTFPTPTTSVSWVHINYVSGGNVSYTVDVNSTGSQRSTTLTIAGQPFTITQSATPCAFSVTPTTLSAPSDYTNKTVTVSTDSTCSWSISSSNTNWLYAYSYNGKGAGPASITVYQNPGLDRVAVLTVAGQPVTVTQTGTRTAIAKPGVFRSGFYWLQDVDGNTQFNAPPDRAFAFGGVAGDIPITGDWNGNGNIKVGVYRSSNGLFILDYDGDGVLTSADKVYNLGVGTQAGDVPVIGDWNGDGRSKVGLFRQGFFWILDTNGNGVFEQGTDQTRAFGGVAGDIPVVGKWSYQYGASQIGLFRQGFYWILDTNGNGIIDNVNLPGGDKAFAYGGIAGDVPVVGDWSGDGLTKVGVFRMGFYWVLDANGNNQFDGTGIGNDLAFPFGGIAGDKPIVGRW